MPRCIPTGKPASPNLHPLAQTPAMQAGATLEEIVEAGATYGRCITSQEERSSSPDTPMTKGRLRSPLDPIDQPFADWMHTIVVADGPRAGACPPHASSRPVDCSPTAALFPWPFVYPLATLFIMSGKDSGFRIRVERELREKFLAACREQDRPAAQVLREFMRSFVSDTDQPNERREGGRRNP
mgnify:CR=1 FL=1